MGVLERNIEYALAIARSRDDKPYGYGGCWTRFNTDVTTDCSGIVTHMLDALLHGPEMTWSRHGISTEAYRYVGGPGSRGPFGTVRVARPRDIPEDAVLKIGLHHEGAGGPFSHMACTLEGFPIESAGGGKGQNIGRPARGFDDPYFHDWFYLPGTIEPIGAQPDEIVFLQLGSKGRKVLVLQKRLNRDFPVFSHLVEDGDFGEQTERVVIDFQRASGLVADGIAGPATLSKLGLPVRFDDPLWDEELSPILDPAVRAAVREMV
jgi:hypothetical protein